MRTAQEIRKDLIKGLQAAGDVETVSIQLSCALATLGKERIKRHLAVDYPDDHLFKAPPDRRERGPSGMLRHFARHVEVNRASLLEQLLADEAAASTGAGPSQPEKTPAPQAGQAAEEE